MLLAITPPTPTLPAVSIRRPSVSLVAFVETSKIIFCVQRVLKVKLPSYPREKSPPDVVLLLFQNVRYVGKFAVAFIWIVPAVELLIPTPNPPIDAVPIVAFVPTVRVAEVWSVPAVLLTTP